MRRLDWAQYRADEFDGLDPEQVIAVLPTAAIEQHGPHLPVGVDTMIANGMLEQLRRTCPDDLDLRILPVQSIGKSNEHLDAKGTLSLSAQSALTSWSEIGLSVARAGVRKIAIVNSHGGNLDLVSILSRELRVRAGMLAVKCQWTSFGYPSGMYPDHELKFGIHGGDFETSVMLHLHPDLVEMSHAANFTSTAETARIAPIGPTSLAWIARDLNVSGTVGDASVATPEKGRASIAHQVAGFIDLLRNLRDTPVRDVAPVLGP